MDVTAGVARDEDFLLMPEHVTAWERQHGRISPNAWVLLRAGWSKRTDRERFLEWRSIWRILCL
jgi:kynurenine formamidase